MWLGLLSTAAGFHGGAAEEQVSLETGGAWLAFLTEPQM